MEYKGYVYVDKELKDITFTVDNCPFKAKEIKHLISHIFNYTVQTRVINEAIDTENIIAIKNFLGKDINRWKKFSYFLFNRLSSYYNEINSIEELSPFLINIIKDPNFKLPFLSINSRNYEAFIPYLYYKYMNVEDFCYMLDNDNVSLINKLKEFIRDYFPYIVYEDTTDARSFIRTMLKGTNYGIGDVPIIIYNAIRKLPCKLTELVLDYSYEPLQYTDTPFINLPNYTTNGKLMTINTFYLRGNEIILDPVTITSSIDFVSMNNQRMSMTLSSLYDFINYTFPRILDIKILGNDKERWSMVSDMFTRMNIKEVTPNILEIINHELFFVNNLQERNHNKYLIDEIKLKSHRKLVPYYISMPSNINVIGYLVYDMLYEIFKNKMYWKNAYIYNIKYRNSTDTKQVNEAFIIDLYTKEGIVYESMDATYNLLTILSTQYYTLNKDMSKYKNLSGYHNYISSKINLDGYMSNIKLLREASKLYSLN